MELSWYTTLHADDGKYLHDLDHALDKANLRKWFIEYEPPANDGYIFDEHPNFKEIRQHMNLLKDHSGASYGITCRMLKKILCLGYHIYETTRLLENTIQQLQTSNDPELKKQGQVLQQFKDGKISYADMRSHCG